MAGDVKFRVAAVDEASSVMNKIAESARSLWSKTSQAFNEINKSAGQTKGIFAWLSNQFQATFWALASYDIAKKAGQSFLDFWKQSIKLASDLEQTKVAFTTMTWSGRIADAFIREMVQFAKTTPFELTQLETASKQLLAFWFNVSEVLPNLKNLWDIAAWVGMDKLPNLILAFWQVRAKTKLMGDDLRQFTEAWVPLIEELASSLHKTVPEIMDMVSTWQIWFPLVQTALQNLTKEWGRFFNLMEAQSKTFGWMVSNFKDALSIMMRDLWTNFLPSMKTSLWELLAFWDENWKSMTISFAWMVQSVVWFFIDWMSGIWEVISTIYQFFQSETNLTWWNVLWTWQAVFLSFGLGLDALKLLFKGTWAYILYQLENAAFSSQIAWAKVKHYFATTWESIGALMKMASTNIWVAFWNWATHAMEAVNWIIDALNKIPWINLDKVLVAGTKDYVWLKDILKQNWQVVQAYNERNQEIIALEENKKTQLWYIDEATSEMLKAGVSAMVEKYEKVIDAQNNASQSWESLKKVLEELGRTKWKLQDLAWGADKWKKGLSEASKEAKKLQDQINNTSDTAREAFTTLSNQIANQKDKVKDLVEKYNDLKKKLVEVWTEGEKQLKKIQESLDEQDRKINENNGDAVSRLAEKYVSLQEKIDDARKSIVDFWDAARRKDIEQVAEETKGFIDTLWWNEILAWGITVDEVRKYLEIQKQIKDSQNEQQQYLWYIDQEALNKANQSDSQNIIDERDKKNAEVLKEKQQFLEKYNEEKQLIQENKAELLSKIAEVQAKAVEENTLYKSLLAERKTLEIEYFDLFQINITKQINKTQEAINLIDTLKQKSWGQTVIPNATWSRALGWSVTAGETYLVWENGPELFTPSITWGITPNNKINSSSNTVEVTINFGNVNLQNEVDLDKMTSAIEEKLIRTLQLYKLWIG